MPRFVAKEFAKEFANLSLYIWSAINKTSSGGIEHSSCLRLVEETYEQYMDLACSASGSCPADFVKDELHPALSPNSEPSGLKLAPRSGSNDLGMSEPSNKRLSAAERNRQAQKRFRQRQKVRNTDCHTRPGASLL